MCKLFDLTRKFYINIITLTWSFAKFQKYYSMSGCVVQQHILDFHWLFKILFLEVQVYRNCYLNNLSDIEFSNYHIKMLVDHENILAKYFSLSVVRDKEQKTIVSLKNVFCIKIDKNYQQFSLWIFIFIIVFIERAYNWSEYFSDFLFGSSTFWIVINPVQVQQYQR